MLQKFKHNTNDYPSSDGRPMAETDRHREIMVDAIEVLKHRYQDDPNIYVSGNLLLFYEEGNKRRHVSPDVFVIKGVPNLVRDNYLMWEEGKGPDVVIEITSRTTRKEDIKQKYDLYLNRLAVREYFLFDPLEEYLKPSMQGFRRRARLFVAIRPVADRLPSQVLGLHLERSGSTLRFWDPISGAWVLTSQERFEQERVRAQQATLRAETEHLRWEQANVRAETERLRAEQILLRADVDRLRAGRAEADCVRLQQELNELRRRVGDS